MFKSEISTEQFDNEINISSHSKYCGRCKKIKPISDFAKNISKVDGLQERCRPCRKVHYKDKRVEVRKSVIKKKYGISLDEYNMILKSQGDVCAICKSKTSGKKSGIFCIDHDHSTGVVRGLLCSNCNRGLGLLGDTEENLLNAWRYLYG